MMFMVAMKDADVRKFEAQHAMYDEGALILLNEDDLPIAVFVPGEWRYCHPYEAPREAKPKAERTTEEIYTPKKKPGRPRKHVPFEGIPIEPMSDE